LANNSALQRQSLAMEASQLRWALFRHFDLAMEELETARL
jgi:hypothetical protein